MGQKKVKLECNAIAVCNVCVLNIYFNCFAKYLGKNILWAILIKVLVYGVVTDIN